MMTLLPPCSLLFLTACAATSELPPRVVTEVKVERVQLPAALLTCDDAPSVPQPPVTQRVLAGYVVDLAAAGDDCRKKLNQIKALSGP